MNIHTRAKVLTVVAATPALLVLGAANAQATLDTSACGPVRIIADLPTPRICAGFDGFNPAAQARRCRSSNRVGLGGADTKIGLGSPEEAPRNPGSTIAINIYGC